MAKTISLIGAVSVAALLAGCQAINSDLDQINGGLSQLTGQGTPVKTSSPSPSIKKQIKNTWNVSNSQAMAWLAQNNPTWNDNGKLTGVNWYDFWLQQIHYKTDLAKQAFQYCHKNAWEIPKPGANCQTYFQAYSMTNSEEGRSFGKKMEAAE